MSAVLHAPSPATPRIALIGAGRVGRALLERIDGVAYLATSRRAHRDGATRDGRVAPGVLFAETNAALADSALPLVVDATASDEVASLHAAWLARGIHVVTANKAGVGASFDRWFAIERARTQSGAHYGDAATVGAGLPVLRTLRRLRAGGERLHALAGQLSGSLAWICDRPADEPLATRVQAAQRAGLTEPDPAEDLSGQDVARKLLVLARAAGHALEPADVRVTPVTADAFAEALREARASDRVVRYVARIDGVGGCSAGLETLARDDALAGASGSDLRIAIHCDRYRVQPLVLQGAGAGPAVTAAALLDDVRAAMV